MMENTLVYHGADAPIDDLLDQAIKNPAQLDVRDVDVIEAARAAEGEVWSPQLPAYRAWVAGPEPDDVPSGSGREGDLFSAGALWMGEFDELLAQAADAGQDAGCASASLRARMDEGLRGAVGVRQVPGGYALTAFDLHRFAAAVGESEDLVVMLPAFVDGVPVVRVAVEAFARRFVQGVGVRLLVVPDTVKHVAANAFAAMSAQRIHIGRNVSQLGEQRCDLAGVSPRLARREYSVDAANARYCAREGSLFSHDGKELVFLASPYGERVSLPDGVERVVAAAFADGCEPPAVVDSSPALARVDARGWDDAVWRCPAKAPAYRALRKRGVRLAGPSAVELDGCWYDFDDEGAVLVAGPPKPVSVSRRFAEQAAVRAVAVRGKDEAAAAAACGLSPSAAAAEAATEFAASGEAGSTVDYVSASASDILALPRQVDGRPLVRIGVRALPFAPASVVVPDTVRVVERDNACRGTKRLVLPEGLQAIGAHCFWSRKLEGPVPLPASCRSVGEGSFEYSVCRLSHTGAIVHVSADQLLSCFLTDAPDGIPFDFARYDELLRSGKNLPDRLGALLHRLATPFRLSEETRSVLVSHLRGYGKEAQERVAREGDRDMVEALVEAGFIDEASFDRQIELLRSCNRTDCVAYLMEWHRGQCAAPSSLQDRFAL
ncbi:hypothetical protein [Paraeggerthella hongkongensis]|uniref:Uncharacterized protein n=1 Tax=Paraeggerthella hongkongensis TaxID=230658 RepID=A0A3N0BLP4_9ACTN|nr:hypothetical protein [Paraeggerthella hongkongensis]RNL49081.1 hypothetical protein DMP08_01130 [Paraeggerthella hongkongensis]